ncbi:MAG: putative SOS response-associated peptidase YedK [Halieaceae bacterium]|jgi:putative SOS response-associated peptidase YedK
MCGRFNVIDNPDLQQLLQELGIDLGLATTTNIAPTETIAVVCRDAGSNAQLREMRWWLTPSWAPEISTKYSMFNAKSETLASSRAFKGSFQRRRGVVPVSSFIEWKTEAGVKQPYLIAATDGALPLAAIWDRWVMEDQELFSCALVTTAAAEGFRDVHHRMPVMLDGDGCKLWLDNAAELENLQSLFTPTLRHDLRVTPIDRRVNNARNKGSELLLPTGEGRLVDR